MSSCGWSATARFTSITGEAGPPGVLSTVLAVLAALVLVYGTTTQTIDHLATTVALTVLLVSLFAGIRLLAR